VIALLADEQRRLRVVTSAQALLSGEMSMESVLPRVLGSLVE
jgi:hypothetical protein